MPSEEKSRIQQTRLLIEQRVKELPFRPLDTPLITPPPTSLHGYTLSLINNSPTPLTLKEYTTAQEKIQREQAKLSTYESYFEQLKVNITSARVTSDGNNQEVIEYTTAPSYYSYHRGGIDSSTPYETARKLTHSGASIVVITGDGMIALSSRPDNVQLYPRAVAATASGSWDGEYQKIQVGHNSDGTPHYKCLPILEPPTPEKATAHIKKELREETGLPNDIINSSSSQLTITGIAEDPRKKHWDILYMMRLPKHVSADDMRIFHGREKTTGSGHTTDPIPGHLIFVPATPEAVATFLTQVRAPWDAPNRTALLMTGYMLKLEQVLNEGKTQEEAVRMAKGWMKHVELGITRNEYVINKTARSTRRRKLNKAWSNFRKATLGLVLRQEGTVEQIRVAAYDIQKYRRRPKGYDVHRVPRKQGLPEVKDELKRNGFFQEDASQHTANSRRLAA